MKCKNLSVLFIVLFFTVTLFACTKQESQKGTTNEEKQKSIELMKKQQKLQAEKKKIEKEEKIRQNIRDFLKSGSYSGVVTVVKGNDTIFNEGVGYADVDKKTLNQPETTFPIGSITKIFVSTCVMKLQEEGKLNIQDPVSKYLPGFPNGQNIKLYNFLTHTSGIDRLHWHRGDTTPLKLVQEIERQPEKFSPGTKWDYLDANYMVLGYIIEKITGQNLHDYIKMNILDKVPMKESGFITPEHPVPYSSIGYIKKDDKTETTKYLSVYPLFACGDIYTTASDLGQFDQALMNGKLISTNSLNQILTPSGLSSYGLGLYKNKEGMAYSVGVLGGWYSIHAYYPDKTSIVILLNVRSKTNIELALSGIRQIVQANDQDPNQKT
jgi:CubicO group peptidase (beta-lactamase class C family)